MNNENILRMGTTTKTSTMMMMMMIMMMMMMMMMMLMVMVMMMMKKKKKMMIDNIDIDNVSEAWQLNVLLKYTHLIYQILKAYLCTHRIEIFRS